MPASVWILNLTVLGVVLEADLGRRKIGWVRVLRPLVTAALIGPLFLTSIPVGSHNLALEAAGVAAGVLVGLAAHLFLAVGYGPVRTRKGPRERSFSRAGAGYAAFWVVIFGGRLLFIYGSAHWVPAALGRFLAAHDLSLAGLTDALIFMAIAMALARSALLGLRGRAAGQRAADHPTAAAPATRAVR